MKVLIACEFRKLGHKAYSCDIQEPSGGHPGIAQAMAEQWGGGKLAWTY